MSGWKDRSNRLQDTCIHFRGINHERCLAGVDWRLLTGGDHVGIALRMPCMRGNNSTVECDYREWHTDEAAARKLGDLEAAITRHFEDDDLINAAHQMDGGVSQVFVCEMCDRSQRFVNQSRAELLEHFRLAHKLVSAEWVNATQEHIRHSDAQNWFQDDYRIVSNGRVLCLRSSRISRRHDDWRR